MAKTGTFTDKDKDLIHKINKKGLSHFIDAVRQLCN